MSSFLNVLGGGLAGGGGGGGGGGGASTFDQIGSGTNTTAAMVVSTGATLTTSGSGSIAATSSTTASQIATTQVTANASFFPLMVSSSTNSNQASSLVTGFTFNPSTGALSTPGSITAGSGSATAGALSLTQGTTQSVGTTNITLQAPTAVTSYVMTLPGAAGTGLYLGTNSAGTVTLTQVALGTNVQTFLTTPSSANFFSAITDESGSGVVVGSASPTFTGTITAAALTSSTGITSTAGTNSIAKLVDAVDGTTPLNNGIQTVASGTAYTLTNTSAAVAFGTTSPIVTLINAGTYLISANVQSSYVGATFAAVRSFDCKLRRTNNTAADLTGGGTFSAGVPIVTTLTLAGPSVTIASILYTTANTTDTIQVFADVSTVPTAGSMTVSGCTITAQRLF